MLLPKKIKFRKAQRKPIHGLATKCNTLEFGDFGIKSLGANVVTSRQIESARRAISRYIKRGGQVWIRIFPDTPITTKGTETPMGSGKGALDHFVAKIKPGTIIFELSGVTVSVAKEAFRLAGHKLPIKIKFITK